MEQYKKPLGLKKPKLRSRADNTSVSKLYNSKTAPEKGPSYRYLNALGQKDSKGKVIVPSKQDSAEYRKGYNEALNFSSKASSKFVKNYKKGYMTKGIGMDLNVPRAEGRSEGLDKGISKRKANNK